VSDRHRHGVRVRRRAHVPRAARGARLPGAARRYGRGRGIAGRGDTASVVTMCGPTRVHVNGVELHYVIQGQGQPVVLVHGGGDDLRYWEAQVGPLSERHRVVTYSRRYVWPNQNPLASSDHSAFVDADDLGALLAVL